VQRERSSEEINRRDASSVGEMEREKLAAEVEIKYIVWVPK